MSSGDRAFWSPQAPVLHANVKLARSHPVTGPLNMLQASLGWCVVTHNSDYPCLLPRQHSECSCVMARANLGPTLGWSCNEAGLGLD